MNALQISPFRPVELPSTHEDYQLVRTAIEFLSENWRNQPSLSEIARVTGTTEHDLHRLFERWAGLTPKAFIQAMTLDHARRLLDQSVNLLDTAYEVGLSGPGRLHDLFVTHEAMSPGAYKARGAGLLIKYGYHPSPFGLALIMVTDRGLAAMAFADPGEEEAALADLTSRWPSAHYVHDQSATAPYAVRIFDPREWRADRPLRVVMIGSDFEIRVWESLLSIPLGTATTYGKIAEKIDKPTASRAVGTTIGRNPISFVVPCHRVLGKKGDLCGYHWGLTRKKAILGWETGIATGCDDEAG